MVEKQTLFLNTTQDKYTKPHSFNTAYDQNKIDFAGLQEQTT